LPDRKRDRPTQNRYDKRVKVQPSVMTQITLTEAQQHLTEIISGLQPGEEVQILQDDRPIARLTLETDGNLHLNRLQAQIQNLQGIFKDIAPGVSLSDELIADRRQEAQREG
jgi:antitoxin (DNA-binding transcriptional repressor) of toxin-antitoxin stability system